jgi:hypothetical protein
MSEHMSHGCIIEDGDWLEGAITSQASLCSEHMEVGVEIETVSEGLDNG